MLRRLFLIIMVITIGGLEGNPLTIAASAPQQAWACPPDWNVDECTILQILYTQTDGPNWIDQTHWGTSYSPWYGVTTDDTGQTIELDLSENRLSGSISPEIGNLDKLQYLNLYSNELNGDIPPELGKLSHLEDLYLGRNQLSGGIPPEIWNLTNLVALDLDSNELSGSIPSELSNLSRLESLDLEDNQLSGSIPSELSNLSHLKNLDLSNNALSGNIPPELSELANLWWLKLGDNQLSGSIPPELGQLTDLGYLYLNHNHLSGSIPPELGNLINLRILNLSRNELSGSIPPELGRLPRLSDLDLNHNYLSGSIPPELGNLTHLENLDFNNNQLSGSLPEWMDGTGFTTLHQLHIHHNCELFTSNSAVRIFLNGKDRGWQESQSNCDPTPVSLQDWACPSEWNADECNVLRILYSTTDGPAWYNQMNWGRPLTPWDNVTVDDAGYITELRFRGNWLSGSIPPELGSLSHLRYLDLSQNELNGGIPAELSKLPRLEYLGLGSNQLSGDIPPELGDLAHLQALRLDDNQLSGSIPSELSKLARLESLDLGSNQLGGNIPPELGDLVNLRSLYLGGNQLIGSIPPELSKLWRLKSLDLGSNQLSGSIPLELGNLTYLCVLGLNTNQLSGPLPEWLDGNTEAGHPPLDCLHSVSVNNNCGLAAPNSAVLTFLESNDPDWRDTQASCEVASAPDTIEEEHNMAGCENSLLTPRLAINSTGRVLPGVPNNLRSQPDTEATLLGTIPGGAEFMVLEGPVCDGTIIWWQVSYGPLVGWTSEGQGTAYWVEPTASAGVAQTTLVPAMTCGGLTSRLSIGQVGRVLPGDPNNLRDAPRPDAQWIGQILGGELFTVVDGPECSNNTIYWRVEYGDLTGWTGEGMNGVFWVEPVN